MVETHILPWLSIAFGGRVGTRREETDGAMLALEERY